MFKRSSIMIALAGVVACTTGYSAPANPFPVTIEQPDGTSFIGYAKGDEVQGWLETPYGYTVVQHPTTLFYQYAVVGKDGMLEPSGEVVPEYHHNGHMVDPNLSYPKHVKPPKNLDNEMNNQPIVSHPNQRISEYQVGVGWTPSPVSGNKRVLTVLVGFNDTPITSGSKDYWSRSVYHSTSNSVTKFYRDNSFGRLNIVPVPHTQPNNTSNVIVVNIPYNHPNCKQSCSSATETQWVTAAMAQVASIVDFASIDTNHDKIISPDELTVYFITGGYEASVNPTTSPSIWAHASAGKSVTFGQYTISRWATSGEKFNSSSFMSIGVIVHELGHTIVNLPDLYDTSGVNSGIGAFSVMSSGSWGRSTQTELAGTTPTNLDAWSREYLGWSTPVEIAQTQTVIPFRDSVSSQTAGVKLVNRNIKSSEYWLIENRTPSGWDRGLIGLIGYWSGGLLIQHIDSTIGTWANNNFNTYIVGSHQGNVIEQASSSSCSLAVASTYGCPSLMFSSGVNFTSSTVPNPKYYTGVDSGFGVTKIDPPGPVMYATITRGTSIVIQPQTATLNTIVTPQGLGSVVVTPTSTECVSNCSVAYSTGTLVTVNAYPYSGSQFVGWTGACVGSISSCTFKIATKSTVVAYFVKLSTRLLTVNKVGTGTISLGSGIVCGSRCTSTSVTTSAQPLTLTAVPAIGYRFVNWLGSCVGTDVTCVVPAGTTNVNATATFTLLSTPVTVPKSTTRVSTTLLNYSNISGTTGINRWYAITVPQGTTRLVISTSHGSGNPDVYVQYNTTPSVTSYGCKSVNPSVTEQCVIVNPKTDSYYYIMLRSTGAYSGVTLLVQTFY